MRIRAFFLLPFAFCLCVFCLLPLAGACGSIDLKPLPAEIDWSSSILMKVVDPLVVDGPVVEFRDPADLSALRGCDRPPENTVDAGEARLRERRAARGSAYAVAQENFLLRKQPGPTDLEATARAIRARYETLVLPQLTTPPVIGIDTRPFTLVYHPSFTGLENPVRVHGRRVALRGLASPGPPREIVLYYLNYDRSNPAAPTAMFLSAGRIGTTLNTGDPDARSEAALRARLNPSGSYAAALLGHLAAQGWPILAHDDPRERLEQSLTDLRLVDRALLVWFRQVHAIGSSDAIFHWLAFHDSVVRSAYVSGTFIPLWTRNDASATGGPFGSDPGTDSPLIQSSFQWADFALMAAHDGITMGFAINAGGSGLGKAGLINETLPALQRFFEAAGRFEIRGNDRNGDGTADHGESCHDGEPADMRDFFRHANARFQTGL